MSDPVAAYLARLAPSGRRTMGQALATMAGWLTGERDAAGVGWGALRYEDTAAIRAHLVEAYAPATANRALSALRGVLREAWRLGQMSAEDLHKAIDLPRVRGSAPPKGRAVSRGELGALFAACVDDPGPGGARDAAMLAVLYGGGLRRSELVALDVSDYAAGTGALTIRQGKGRKARVAYAEVGTAQYLGDWLGVRGNAPGPLFCPVRRGGQVVLRRMSAQSVWAALARRAQAAGVAQFSPHDLRRTFIGDLLDAGADIATVQRLAGHASVATTAMYDRRPEEARRKAASLLHVPYLRRGLGTSGMGH